MDSVLATGHTISDVIPSFSTVPQQKLPTVPLADWWPFYVRLAFGGVNGCRPPLAGFFHRLERIGVPARGRVHNSIPSTDIYIGMFMDSTWHLHSSNQGRRGNSGWCSEPPCGDWTNAWTPHTLPMNSMWWTIIIYINIYVKKTLKPILMEGKALCGGFLA